MLTKLLSEKLNSQVILQAYQIELNVKIDIEY